jgi:hypothetical protein
MREWRGVTGGGWDAGRKSYATLRAAENAFEYSFNQHSEAKPQRDNGGGGGGGGGRQAGRQADTTTLQTPRRRRQQSLWW